MKYPWLDTSREQFSRLSQHLPHAILVHGQKGLGKHVLAMEMVASLLCDAPSYEDGRVQACGECRNCRMFESGNGPDFHYISSEEFIDGSEKNSLSYSQRYLEAPEKRGKRKPRKVITVDQIRALIEGFALSNHSARNKVALIEPAEAMNINAANALLKLLEEPNEASVLILVCNDVSRLPMTIRSRCVGLSINLVTHDRAMGYLVDQGVAPNNARKALAICAGTPLTALRYAGADEIDNFDKLLLSLTSLLNGSGGLIETRDAILKLQSASVLLSWLQMTMNWMINAQQYGNKTQDRPWQAYQGSFGKLSRCLTPASVPALFVLYEELLELKKQDVDIVNTGLMLDKWLIDFSRL